jgi:hypothetical protein
MPVAQGHARPGRHRPRTTDLGPRTVEQLAAGFQRKPVKAVAAVLGALEAMNLARCEEGRWRLG